MTYPYPYPPEQRGAAAWAVGFVAYLPIPFIGQVIGGLLMAVVGVLQRGKGPLAAEQGRRAANWGLTYALGTVVAFAGGVGAGYLSSVQPQLETVMVGTAVTLIVLWMILNVVHVVVVVVALVQSSKGLPARIPAIAFLRAR